MPDQLTRIRPEPARSTFGATGRSGVAGAVVGTQVLSGALAGSSPPGRSLTVIRGKNDRPLYGVSGSPSSSGTSFHFEYWSNWSCGQLSVVPSRQAVMSSSS